MPAPLKVGIAGLGTVGASVVRLVAQQREALAARCGRPVEIVAVCARSRGKDRGIDLKKMRWVGDPVKLATDPGIDAFVELMGGEGDPARGAVTSALKAGKSVVTANKALLARHGIELAGLAEKCGVALNFEAAVAGAIPVIKTLREGFAGNKVSRIYGILNGTCNYMLTRMEREKLSFEECLKEAQRLGYAEADPSFDIEGHDTAQKLSILASLAFGTRVDSGGDLRRGHHLDHQRRSRSRRGAWLSHQAPRRRGQDRAGHRAARAPDHGAEGFRHRAGHGRDQRGQYRCRGDRADHAGRTGRRRACDRVRGRFRHRRYRTRRAGAAIRPAARQARRQQKGADAAP